MKRLVPILVAAGLPANAADLPDRICAPAVAERPPLCSNDVTGATQPVAVYTGPQGSLPNVQGTLTPAEQAACRAEADKVRAIASSWATPAEQNRRFGYAFERCAARAIVTRRAHP
jgi:hypothetical protein